MTTHCTHTPRGNRGVTLLELMIVVAVISILGAIAYPNYREYVRKGRRAEARTALLELRQQQERYMTQFNTYKAFTYGDSAPFLQYAGSNKAAPTYKLSAVQCDKAGGSGKKMSLQSCIKLIAAPQTSDPKAGSLSLTTLGEKDCTGTDKRTCWP